MARTGMTTGRTVSSIIEPTTALHSCGFLTTRGWCPPLSRWLSPRLVRPRGCAGAEGGSGCADSGVDVLQVMAALVDGVPGKPGDRSLHRCRIIVDALPLPL